MINGIFACDQKGGIGKVGGLPWPMLKSDMSLFKKVTKGKTVIMGRKTWDSLPEQFRPLPGRRNIVITSNPDNYDHGMNLDACKEFLEETDNEIFIIGGGEIYKALESYVDKWYMTVVSGDFKCDTFFKPDLSNFDKYGEITITDEGVKVSFKEYTKKK